MLSSKQSLAKTRFWNPYRITITLLVLSLIAAFGVAGCNSTEEKKTAPRVVINPGTTTPVQPVVPPHVLNAELRASSGAPIKLADYGGKVLIVNLWATWCGPCRIEIPELVRLYNEYRSQGVEVVGLSTEDPDDSEAEVKNFVKNHNVDYRVGWATNEVALTLMQGNQSIPQSFIISRDGHIVKRFVGFNVNRTPPQIRQAIEEALKRG